MPKVSHKATWRYTPTRYLAPPFSSRSHARARTACRWELALAGCNSGSAPRRFCRRSKLHPSGYSTSARVRRPQCPRFFDHKTAPLCASPRSGRAPQLRCCQFGEHTILCRHRCPGDRTRTIRLIVIKRQPNVYRRVFVLEHSGHWNSNYLRLRDNGALTQYRVSSAAACVRRFREVLARL